MLLKPLDLIMLPCSLLTHFFSDLDVRKILSKNKNPIICCHVKQSKILLKLSLSNHDGNCAFIKRKLRPRMKPELPTEIWCFKGNLSWILTMLNEITLSLSCLWGTPLTQKKTVFNRYARLFHPFVFSPYESSCYCSKHSSQIDSNS